MSKESLYPENKLTKVVGKDTVYIERSIADSFQLSNFKSLIVAKVEPELVALDSVELLFKEQYLGRSEMWRLKQSLCDSVVFLNKKINFSKDAIRCTVNEMWGSGERVACGFVNQDTKVVFRSTSAMIYIFVQVRTPFEQHKCAVLYRWHLKCGTLICTGTCTLRRQSMASSMKCFEPGRIPVLLMR